MRALLLALLLLPSLAYAQEGDLSDIADGAVSAAQDARRGPGGINLPEDAHWHIPVYVYLDGTGLSAGQKQALKDAGTLDGDGNCIGVTGASSKRLRLVCKLTKHGTGWYRDGAEGVIYTLLPRRFVKKLIGLADARVQVFEGRWDKVATHARCADFFPAASCGVGADPDGAGPLEPEALHPPPHAVFADINPNRGRPQEPITP